jgi:hypothetical protein
MSEPNRYHVYLGVPGVQIQWGTVTGVINSTKKHVVHPFSGGLGFSGVVDFNHLWTDAHNLYEAGTITHFAMLHGDITPDPTQRWLDVLMDVMEKHGAALVSAHLPIKDNRGITSSGICDPTNPWGAYRRFTQQEILNDLPKEFDNTLAGYPDKPLLHNTGCWVCDLRRPAFHATNPDGSLKFLFRFPERIIRGPDGKWGKQQESEDWLLSRELWEAGIRNTWITTEVRLTHHGKLDFPNWIEFGKYKQGDEDTAANWRPKLEERPLALTQMIEFELGSKCNLGHIHSDCPNMHPDRYGDLDTTCVLDDDTIVRCAVEAYRDLGFTGMIGWIYYNEPLLQMDRMFGLMDRIKAEAPKARFILWTNGMLVPEDCSRFKAFTQIIVSEYNEQSRRGYERLASAGLPITPRLIENAALDNRLHQIEPADKSAPCLRPFTEFIVDYHGNVHLCCYDWQGKASPGNVFTDGFAEVAQKWRDLLPHLCGDHMTAAAPRFCQDCGHRWTDKHQLHDQPTIDRANRWRKALMANKPEVPS